jgi:hypothetical protein
MRALFRNIAAAIAIASLSVSANPYLSILAGSVASSGTTLKTGLVGYWTLDEAEGNSRVDSTGTTTLAETGGTVGANTGKLNSAADFALRATRFLAAADNATLSMSSTQQFSIQCWLYIASNSGSYVLTKGTSTSDSACEYEFYYDSGTTTLQFYVGSGAANQHASSSALSTATWYHIVGTYDKTNITVYVNGVAGTPQAYSTGSQDSAGSFRIGASGAGGTVFTGRVDEVGVWKKVLTGSEITQLYNGGTPLPYSSW